MPLVVWTDRYATGIEAIDEQHQQLFKAVNDLHDGLMAGKAKESIEKTLDFLVEYTLRHFQTEENFMHQQGFEGLPAHRSEHKLLLDEVATFREQYTRNAAAVRPMEVARFLGDWLTHHIHQMDMQYALYVKGRGAR